MLYCTTNVPVALCQNYQLNRTEDAGPKSCRYGEDDEGLEMNLK